MAGPVFADSEADAQRRRGLRRMRAVALSMLAAAAVVYLLTLDRGDPWTFVHAASEAAMVGAIADWFAVTALFRHPMGIPIPHTAIIPTRKNALAKSLQEFVTSNFLAEDVIRTRMADAQVGRRLATWLADEKHSTWAINEAAALAETALKRIRDDDVAILVESSVLPRLREEPLSEIAGRLLSDVLAEQAHHGLVDIAIDELHRWLTGNEAAVSDALATRAPWWTPQWLDERVTRRIHAEAVAWVGDVKNDKNHQARKAIDDLLNQLATDLESDPATIERAERLKQRVLSSPHVLASILSIWRVVRDAMLHSMADSDSPVRARAVQGLMAFGVHLDEDAELRSRIDEYASDAAAFLVQRYGDELTTVITDTVERWDGREAAERIELYVGRDLQFIRINGTLVGGLAGLAIYSVSRLL